MSELSEKIEELIRDEVSRRSALDADEVRRRLDDLANSFMECHLIGGKPRGDYADVAGSIRVAMRDLGLWEGDIEG